MNEEQKPMISRIDHVSLAVKDFKQAREFFEKIFGAVRGVGAREESLKYFWNIFSLGDLSRLEIMEPTGQGSFLDNFLSPRKTGGVHHMSLETPDIQKFKAHLDHHGIPYFGYAEIGEIWKELFIHPRDAFGVLIQVAEMADPNDYLAETVKHPEGSRWTIQKNAAGARLALAHPGGGTLAVNLSPEEIGALVADLQAVM
ncbi:MAG: VOC family protein [Desulfococcus multivorans]|jgi:methylmalonyl-CoA/ethylmalonyl-CoA epimerase|nr:VOC family protein [Desulfococcus multivorans]